MAYLLGAAAVMDSLQRDVRDVQSCVVDITSRTGPVHCTSWKFPDKSASDLDIEDLLDLYSYSDDEEERQVAHIALYELVIDRLMLLLHTMAAYTEGVLKTAKSDIEPGHVTGTSVGVVVKKYWSRLGQLQQVVKHAVTEKHALSRKTTELEGDVCRLNAELKQSYNTNRPKTAGFGGLIPLNRAEMTTGLSLNPSQLKQFGLISRDEYNKSCQTNETSFTPCDSCSIVQKSFRQSGELIVNICQQQQIPSCLQKFRPQVSHLDWLSGNDVSRWSSEQNKDLQRICKLTATIKPLKEELNACVTLKDKMENRVLNFDRDLKKERDERVMMNKQYDVKIKELERQHTQTLELEKQQKDLLEMNKQELEKMLEKHKTELREQQGLLKELESTKSKMEEELSSKKVDMAEVSRLQQDMSSLQSKLDDVSIKMDTSSRELNKEQAKNKSASKHSQSLQSKQASLLQRIEALDEENSDLKEQLSELEEEKDKIEESVNDTKRETTTLARQLKEKEIEIEHVLADKESLEQTITTLETSIETLNDKLETAKEQERLIVEYPDINGPVNPDISGTGDIVLDMENQVKANTIRIHLLENQNIGLRNSIQKMVSMHHHGNNPADLDNHHDPGCYGDQHQDESRWATNVQSRPQPLWDPSSMHKPADNHAYREPEYSHMEYKYNQSDNFYKNNENHSGNKTKTQTGVKTFEFDGDTVQHNNKTSPDKNRPPFGHRPLSGANNKKTSSDFVVGKMVRPESAKKRDNLSSGKSRPSSGKTGYMAPIGSSIGAYIQLKKEGKITAPERRETKTAGSRPLSGKPYIPTCDTDSNYSKQDNFMCENCDKMYTRPRDLEIHKSYCTG